MAKKEYQGFEMEVFLLKGDIITFSEEINVTIDWTGVEPDNGGWSE